MCRLTSKHCCLISHYRGPCCSHIGVLCAVRSIGVQLVVKKKNRKGGKAAASSGPRASPGQILSIHSPGHLRGLGQAHSAAVCGAVSRTTRTCKFGSCSVHLTRGCQPYGQPGGGQPAASGCKTCPDCRDGPEPRRVRLRIHDVVCSLPFLCPP